MYNRNRSRSDDHPIAITLLNDEQHRTANELAAALAALQLVRRMRSGRSDLIDTAIARLEGFASTRRTLTDSQFAGADAVIELPLLFAGMMRGRHGFAEIDFMTSCIHLPLNGRVAGTLLRCAHEMVTNAWKHSDAEAPIRVTLRATATKLELAVLNDCVTQSSAGSRGCGQTISQALCRHAGGRYQRRMLRDVHIARVILPRSPRPEVPVGRHP